MKLNTAYREIIFTLINECSSHLKEIIISEFVEVEENFGIFSVLNYLNNQKNPFL